MKTTVGMRREARGESERGVAATIIAVVAFISPIVAHAGDAQQALQWLQSTQRADGSWCHASYQPPAISRQPTCAAYTAEVLETGSRQWAAGSGGAAAVAKGVVFMENVVPHDTGTLARKLAVSRQLSAFSYVRTEEVEKLKSLVTTDGGFAAWEFFATSDMYRTIQALKFFAGYDAALAASAAGYLVSAQHADGSFSPSPSASSQQVGHDVGTTAQAVMALALAQSYVNVGPAITAGLDFIVSQANADGSIGSISDPVRETAWGVLAVQTLAGDVNNIVPMGVAYLTSQFDAESSLRGDAVLTALYVRIAGQDRPDLLVAPRGVQVSPAVAETGHPVDITVEVRNAGFADAGAFVVALRSLTVAAQQEVAGLAAGATTMLTFEIADAGESGVKDFTATVDLDNQVQESVETNNTTRFSVKVGTRDLAVAASQVGTVPVRPYPERPFNLFATVRSLGDLASSNVRVALYDGDPDTGGALIEEQIVPSIAASGSSIVSYSLTSPTASKTYCVTVNRTGELRESNTQNNKACITVNILSQPDLTFATLRIIIPSVIVTEGAQVPLKVVVANTGTSEATNATIRFLLNDPLSGTPIGSDIVLPVLPAGALQEVVGPVFDTTGMAGTKTVYAVADPDNAILEADEYNNLSIGTLDIRGRPDLYLTSTDIQFSPEPPVEGRFTAQRVYVTARNSGLGPSGPFTVTYYLGNPLAGGTPLPTYGYED